MGRMVMVMMIAVIITAIITKEEEEETTTTIPAIVMSSKYMSCIFLLSFYMAFLGMQKPRDNPKSKYNNRIMPDEEEENSLCRVIIHKIVVKIFSRTRTRKTEI